MTSTAGTASYRKNEITLSLPFFADDANFDSHLFETVTHEAAHLVVGMEGRNGKPHGPQFRKVHRAMGGKGERTHDMALAEGFTKRKRKPRTEAPCGCGCGEMMKLGPVQLKKQLSGKANYMFKGHSSPRKLYDFFGDIL
jgi:predicted SprT family Zn-dependent metalloprotease